MATRGSNKVKCAAYKAQGTRILNRKRKLNKHIALHPNDADAIKALKQTN